MQKKSTARTPAQFLCLCFFEAVKIAAAQSLYAEPGNFIYLRTRFIEPIEYGLVDLMAEKLQYFTTKRTNLL